MKFLSFIFTALLLFATQLYAHCQIPCGVYDDTMRVKMIEEHTLTILKSMNYIASNQNDLCLLYTSPSPRDVEESRMPSSA